MLLFGLRAETRNFLQLVPFLCLGGVLATKSGCAAPLAVGLAKPPQATDTSSPPSQEAR